MATLVSSILLFVLVLLRSVVNVDPFVDKTPHIRFFIRLDEEGVVTQRADDKTLITQSFLVFLLQIYFRYGVTFDNDAFSARKDGH